MKIQSAKSSLEQGNFLIVSLIVSAILGITLASYMIMTQNQNLSVMRSQNWNSSMVVSEAGVEDGLQLINNYAGTFDALTNWCLNASSNGYSIIASDVYYVRRYMGSNYYDVFITNNPVTLAGVAATVTAIGHAAWSYSVASAPQTMFAAGGVNVSNGPGYVTRTVTVQTKIDALFSVAMAALQTIDFNGNNITTDSFDSADPLYSTNGMYPMGIPSMTKANGDVVTDDTITNSVNVGNADIKGHVKTGPKGTIAIGPNGSVGDRAWVEGGSSGIEPSYFSDDMNVLFPDVTLPSTTWLPATHTFGNGPSSKVNGVLYDYIILNSGDYSIPGDSGNGIYIGTNANVRLLVNGAIALSGSKDSMHIALGGSLTIYMNSASFSLTGNGVVNENGNATSFFYFGLPVNTSVNFGGNASFTGVIYAPEAAFSLGGGGSNPYDFVGSSVTKTVRMNGKFNFHYDENLRRVPKGRGYIPTNWREKASG
jgi:hypothetical protein